MTNYIKIPTEILQDEKLNHTQILLYGVIMSLTKKEWYCRASNRTLWDMLWIWIWMVQNSIKKLKEEWYISVEIEANNKRKIKVCEISQGCEISHGGMWNITPNNNIEYISTKVDIIPPKKNEEKSTTSWTTKRTTNEHLLVWEKKEQFKKFWDAYPHHTWRSSRKKSISCFLELDTEQVLLWATLLKREVECWIENWQYVKAAERRLKNFTPINETQKQRRLMAIFERHMKQQDGKKERMERLIQDFPDVDFKKLREELSEKNSLLHKMTFT